MKNQLDANPFSCCNTIKALEAFQFVLLQVIDQPLVGITSKVHLQNLTQQLQARFSGYIACLACEPGPTGPTGPTELTAYVTNYNNNTVSIVNLGTNSITGSISGFNGPTGLDITPDGLVAYVPNYFSNDISIVDLGTNSFTGSISGFDGPNAIAIK
ncbi:YncE family protein [Bacillus cereus]|uniref:Uncharacterized protein n=1 Tax=Bacillus cereus TaxID=1396 RepID=A0A9X6ZZD7_BACCE|nr:hypothetical protein [Bacillus cereus]PFK18134.1 hypothetical protein COI98_13045 [Bacillus cereus]